MRHLTLDVDRGRAEPVIGRQIIEAGFLLLGQRGVEPLSARPRGSGVAGMDAQRAAMRGQAIDIEHAQTVPREHLVEDEQREI
jgi:hypothetical protein